MQKALEYLERSMTVEPSATALEQMGQIRLKRDEPKEAVALFERAIALPKSEKVEEIYWRAKLRRDLGDAHEAAGDDGRAPTPRVAPRSPTGMRWHRRLSLTNEGKAEAGIERAKLLYQIGDRDQSLANFEAAIDAAPDRAGTYADVIAFLVPRGELDEALDAYHRALGRNEVTDYLKVYCSLWIADLARRAKQPVDPLASSYLQSTDGGKWYDDLARWATGRETEQQMLGRVDTPAKKAESAYYRAMRAVERGRRRRRQEAVEGSRRHRHDGVLRVRHGADVLAHGHGAGASALEVEGHLQAAGADPQAARRQYLARATSCRSSRRAPRPRS